MRLAIIDYKQFFNGLNDKLRLRNIDVDIATSLEEFEERYGSLKFCDGLLLHPGIDNWSRYLKEIPRKYPKLRYAIASHGIGDYLDNGKIMVFDFSDEERIFNYFFGNCDESKQD